MIQNYLVDPALRVYMIKGTAGNANGKLEYICEAAPGASTGNKVWRIKKLSYDAAGFLTNIKWADGDNSFNKEADEYAGYTYS